MASDPLPLFPLKTVLFPRMPLRLNVFEDRYKLMVKRCIEEKRPFGVVLIRDGSEVGPAAVPESVGTLARILAVKKQDGNFTLLAEGTRRFRLLDYATGAEPYLVGMTEPLADSAVDSSTTRESMAGALTLFHEYFNELVNHAGVTMPSYELPDDPEEFSFVLAAVLQAELPVRQELLELTCTVERLTRERSMLEKDLDRIRKLAKFRAVRAERVPAEKGRPFFSPN